MNRKPIVAMLCLALAAGLSACSPQEQEGADAQAGSSPSAAEAPQATAVGSFQTQTIDGEDFDQTRFQDKKLTMVNIWATWCTPCINELPELEKLSNQQDLEGFQVVTILADAIGTDGQPDEEAMATAREILEKSQCTFPVLVPDQGLSSTLMRDLQAFPTTYFVDSEGNIVGDPVVGSGTAEDWAAEIQKRLEALA